jgi:hypothetical protein
LSKRREWIKPGQEIDGEFSLSTVLAVKGRWREVRDELQTFLTWIRNQEAWKEAGRKSSDSHEESCKVAQVASSLLHIIWDTVQSELPILLEGFAVGVFNPTTRRRATILPQRVLDAVSSLRNVIETQVRAREETTARVRDDTIPVIMHELTVWRQRKDRLRELELEISRITDGAYEAEEAAQMTNFFSSLNKLGIECLRSSWTEQTI